MRRLDWAAALLAVSGCTEPVTSLLRTPAPTDAGAPVDAAPARPDVPPLEDAAGPVVDAGEPADSGQPLDAGLRCTDASPTPPRLDFGAVPAGSTGRASFEICNPGPGRLSFEVLGFTDGAFGTVVFERVLLAGQAFNVFVEISPVELGPVEEAMLVRIDGVPRPVEVPLVAEVVRGTRGPWCEDLRIGSVPNTSCTSLSLDCYNHGPETFPIEGVELTERESASFAETSTLPSIWPADERLEVGVRICPDRGNFETEVRILTTGGAVAASGRIVGQAGNFVGCAIDPIFPWRAQGFSGDGAERRFRLFNRGDRSCEGVRLTLDDPSGAFFWDGNQPGRIGSRDDFELQVRLRPSPAGTYTARLLVEAPSTREGGFEVPIEVEVLPRPVPAVTVSTGAGLTPRPADAELEVWDTSPGADPWIAVSVGVFTRLSGQRSGALYVHRNGFVSLEEPDAMAPVPGSFPDPAGPQPALAWWGDTLAPEAGEIWTFASGGFGSRVGHVQLLDVPLAPGGPTAPRVSVEFRFYEQDQRIELEYGPLVPGAGAFSAAVGWQGPNAETGANLLPCSPSCTAADWPEGTVFEFRDPP